MAGIQFAKEGIFAIQLSRWLDYCCRNNTDSDVVLPLIQRGSVWKPDQIIDLWDSLLRGMPVGSFMLNAIPKGTKVRFAGQGHSIQLDRKAFGLLDGQQRTLAMLAGWPLRNGQVLMDRRVWVDFADKPGKEHLLRLRVTTENHPFGFSSEDGKTKLPLSERRKAIVAYLHLHGEKENDTKSVQLINFRKAFPYSAGNSLPIDLVELIKNYSADDSVFSTWLHKELVNIKNYRVVKHGDDNAPSVECIEVWSVMSDEQRAKVLERIRLIHSSLGHLLKDLYVPLILIDMDSVQDKDRPADEDPALAILFKRVGANGTALSNADYIFSVIKHHCPDAHDLVNALCARKENYNLAALLAPSSLVTTMVRLAVTRCRDVKEKPLADAIELNKQQFAKLLNDEVIINGEAGLFLKLAFEPMITESCAMSAHFLFDALAETLKFKCSGDIGLPAHALVLLKKPLLQVLLLWTQTLEADVARMAMHRQDVIRFILFWNLCVKDADKASIEAFKFIREAGQTIQLSDLYHALVSTVNVAFPVYSPDTLSSVIGNIISIPIDSNDKRPLKGWSRFAPTPDEHQSLTQARDFYRRWWGLGGHVHPLLLWLQRDYVNDLPGSPVAGREEDTPYDYDHILPQNHWSGWTGEGGNAERIAAFMPEDEGGAYGVVGNSIGNVRVWSSSDNRSDGDLPPSRKLADDHAYRSSAINLADKPLWIGCSAENGKYRSWSSERAKAFQRAVEERAWSLYKAFYDDLEFSKWVG